MWTWSALTTVDITLCTASCLSSWTESSTSWGRRTRTWWLERRGSLWWSPPRWSEWEPRKPPSSTSQTSANCELLIHWPLTRLLLIPFTLCVIYKLTVRLTRHRLHRQPKHLLAFLLAELGTRCVSVYTMMNFMNVQQLDIVWFFSTSCQVKHLYVSCYEGLICVFALFLFYC